MLLASGCFYLDPINQRPSADIIQDSSAPLRRGGALLLHASTSDPENDVVYPSWRIYKCTDATAPAGCDPVPALSDEPMIDMMVPVTRDDGSPVQSLRIILDATDSHGAVAEPRQELLLSVGDAAPTVEVRKDGLYGFVAGTPVALYAKYGDPDYGPDKVSLAWQVFPPAGATYTFTDITVMPDPNDPMHLQAGKKLTSSTMGDWDVLITATDPLGVAASQHLPFTLVPDHPPCLGSWAPLAPPPGQTLPMSAATLFEVLTVDDDLDPYPQIVGDSTYGTPTFSWSLLPPGATTRQPLGVIGNSVALDPASYTPGDVLELRVEIADRQHTPVTCSDSLATCSVISDPTCIQRLTWSVEVQ